MAQGKSSPSGVDRVLVVRLGAVGDCLRVLPAVARLREAFPLARIDWLVERRVAPVLEGNPLLDGLQVLDHRRLGAGPLEALAEFRRAGRVLSEARYDVALDFHARLKSGVLVRASGATRRIGYDRHSGSEGNHLFTSEHVSLRDPMQNRIERFLALLGPLGVPTDWDPTCTGLWVDPGAQARAAEVHESLGAPPLAVFAGTSAHRAADRWPVQRWVEALSELGRRGVESVVLWGPDDLAAARAIVDGAGPACRLAPPTTLTEMMALLGRFRLYAGTNTAAMHMAWLQGLPCVVLVGGRPWRTDRPMPPVPSRMLSAGGVEPDRKWKGEKARIAIEGIEAAEVVSAVLDLLTDATPRVGCAPRRR